MVIEGFAALAVAGNICQFIGIAVKVCNHGRNIYNASKDGSTLTTTNQTLTNDLLEVGKALVTHPVGPLTSAEAVGQQIDSRDSHEC